jgi:hypothetical protein
MLVVMIVNTEYSMKHMLKHQTISMNDVNCVDVNCVNKEYSMKHTLKHQTISMNVVELLGKHSGL